MSTLQQAFFRVDDACARVEDAFVATTHAIIALLILLAVFYRYVLNDPLTWGEDFIVGLFTWMIFIGAAAASRSSQHIRIDVMAPIYRNPKMGWLNVVTLILGIVILGVMIYACFQQVLQEAAVELPMLGVSKAWFLTAMPVGLALMVIHIVRLWAEKGAATVFRGETEVELDI